MACSVGLRVQRLGSTEAAWANGLLLPPSRCVWAASDGHGRLAHVVEVHIARPQCFDYALG